MNLCKGTTRLSHSCFQYFQDTLISYQNIQAIVFFEVETDKSLIETQTIVLNSEWNIKYIYYTTAFCNTFSHPSPYVTLRSYFLIYYLRRLHAARNNSLRNSICPTYKVTSLILESVEKFPNFPFPLPQPLSSIPFVIMFDVKGVDIKIEIRAPEDFNTIKDHCQLIRTAMLDISSGYKYVS